MFITMGTTLQTKQTMTRLKVKTYFIKCFQLFKYYQEVLSLNITNINDHTFCNFVFTLGYGELSVYIPLSLYPTPTKLGYGVIVIHTFCKIKLKEQ